MVVIDSLAETLDELVVRLAEGGEEDIVLDLQVAQGEALLVSRAGQPIATLAIADSDAELWGADSTPAYYVSRLAVARRAAGANLGYRLLDWITGKAAQQGLAYVRLGTPSGADEGSRPDWRLVAGRSERACPPP
ncbi:GNAT family N-acetyltransferase [Amycolatopsis lurida]